MSIIMAEVLGCTISKDCRASRWKGIRFVAGVDPLTHLQFANDTFLAGEASAREAQVVKHVIDRYEQVSGQRVNWLKSKIFFFNTPPLKQREINRIPGMKLGTLPSKFLGIPLFGGANKSAIRKNLVESCFNKLEGWKSKWLTLAGKILMLKTIVSAIPIFSMACLKIPNKIINVIKQKMRNFF